MNPTGTAASTAPERIDRFRGDHAFLSNFHRHPFQWRGRSFSTAEHAYQGAKSRDDRERERIRVASSPREAKRLGRRADLRCDWEHVKDDVMHSILQAKFAVPELRDALLATGDAELVEGNTWGDVYWGVCRGRGRNQLGRTLMRIRDDIRRRAGAAMDAQHARLAARALRRRAHRPLRPRSLPEARRLAPPPRAGRRRRRAVLHPARDPAPSRTHRKRRSRQPLIHRRNPS